MILLSLSPGNQTIYSVGFVVFSFYRTICTCNLLSELCTSVRRIQKDSLMTHYTRGKAIEERSYSSVEPLIVIQIGYLPHLKFFKILFLGISFANFLRVTPWRTSGPLS